MFGQCYLIWVKTMTKGAGVRASIPDREMDSQAWCAEGGA